MSPHPDPGLGLDLREQGGEQPWVRLRVGHLSGDALRFNRR